VTDTNLSEIELPGLDCGLCGFRACTELATRLADKPELLKRCIPLAADFMNVQAAPAGSRPGGEARSRDEAPPRGGSRPGGPAAAPSLSIVEGDECATCDPASGCGSSIKRGWGNDAPVLNAPLLAGPVLDTVDATTASETAGQTVPQEVRVKMASSLHSEWHDHLGREFDFLLEHFPEEDGPREQIVPHNPMITRELEIEPGEILIGRPLGISCGCPITHCGIVQSVDMFTGAVVWCVTGPLHPRQHGFKDIGYYSAQAYEGLITKARTEVEIGRRYWFQPRMCMMQWRHSGLVNFINRGADGLQVRIEGLWIG
jgi:uncharacterized Fe-S cluster-containing protein